MKKTILTLLLLAFMCPSSAMEEKKKPNLNQKKALSKKLIDAVLLYQDASKVKKYLEQGADANVTAYPVSSKYLSLNSDNALLILALEAKQEEIACILLDHGADPNIHRKKIVDCCLFFWRYLDEPALVLAAQHNLTDACKKLIEKDTIVTAECANKKTAIMYASEHGNREIYHLLIAKGAPEYPWSPKEE